MAVLIQIDAYDPVAGAAVALRLASEDDARLCMLDDGPWWPTLGTLPKLAYDLFSGQFDGRIETPASSFSLAIEPWPLFARYGFADARVRIWTGDIGQPITGYILRFDGRVTAQPTIDAGQAAVTIAVDDRWLDAPLLALYAGTGGAEGAAGVAQQPKPLALGAPRYAAGTLIDPVNTVVQLSAYGAIEAVDVALDRLARFGPSRGDYASIAALTAAAVPAGTWATARAAGAVRHGAPPAGKLSYLLRGDRAGAGGWAQRPGALIRRIAEIAAQAARLHDASLIALDAARPYNLSLMVTDQTTPRDLIQRIAASVNAVAGVTWLGQLFLAPVGIRPAAVAVDLRADGSALPPVAAVAQVETGAAFWRGALTAERAWEVHAPEDIAFTATLIEIGLWDAATVYREGNIVSLADGSRWLYIAVTPSAGNPLPTPPSESNAWWRMMTGPIAVEWDTIADPNGTKPEDNADVTANHTAANTAYVGPKPVDIFLEDVASNLRSTLQQIGRLDLLDQFVNEIAYSSGQRIDIKVAELAARQTTDTGAYDVQLSKVAVFSADGTTARLSDALLYSNANGDQVYVAQELRTLFASTAEHNAQIQNIQKIVLTPNGQFAKIAMLADVDGTVVGFEGTTDGVKSNFRIKTNDFRLVDDQNTVTMNPFSYVDQRFYLDDVYIRLLEVGSVKTESMALFAAGNTLGFRSTTIVNGSGSAPSSAFNILINANIAMVRTGKITVLAYVNHAYTASADYGLDVVVDNGAAGGANEAGGAGAYTNGVNTNDSFDLSAGSHNLKLRWRGSSGIRVELASLIVLISY